MTDLGSRVRAIVNRGFQQGSPLSLAQQLMTEVIDPLQAAPRGDAVSEAAEPEDTLALTGLRRMVLHARDNLAATRPVPNWTYNSDAWSPAQIRRHAAHLLAEQVLTLVAECIPGGERISADEAAQRVADAVAERDKAERKLQAEVARMGTEVTKLTGNLELLTAERDNALDGLSESEAIEADMVERLAQAERLAKTDVPAAVRYLLGEDEPSADESPTEPREETSHAG